MSYIQRPTAYLDYSIDWTPYLNAAIGETIQTLSVAATPAGLTLTNAAIVGNRTVVWVTGGELWKSYRVTFTVTTSTGATDHRSIYIKISNIK